jgi:release factor glutamine methyltransferase
MSASPFDPPEPSGPLDRPELSDVVAALRAAGSVFAEDEAQLIVAEAHEPGRVAAMVEQRAYGLPLEHVLGWAEFCGQRIVVEPGVFVPRRRTELLVREATALLRTHAGSVVVDLCCGSGAVGVVLADAVPGAEVYAADLDARAVRCARRNLGALGCVYQGDLFEPLPDSLRGRIDVLAANVPYVPTGEIGLLPPEARVHESRVALDGGADGLDVLRRVSAGAREWLAPGGHVLFETSEQQAPGAMRVLSGDGLAARVVGSHEPEATVVVGTRDYGRRAPG